jgi:integrase
MAEGPKGRTRVERGIYRQPNGKFAVCARRAGRLHFRTAGNDLGEGRHAREDLVGELAAGRVPASPRLRFDTVAGRWLGRFEAKVAAGERHPRTLEAHRYQLEQNLLPSLSSRRIASIAVDDIAALLEALRDKGCSAKTRTNALATLQSILRYDRRRGWIVIDPIELLESEERPRHRRRRQRVLGRAEIERLLSASLPGGRLLIATALFSGLRISELLGLIWEDVDFTAGLIRVRAQLSRAHRGEPRATGGAEDACLGARGTAGRTAHPPARRAQASHIRSSAGLGLRHRARHPSRAPQRRATGAAPRGRYRAAER